MSQIVHGGEKIINEMPRSDFHQKFVRGICKTRAFGALFSFKAENISPEERLEVRTKLADCGIPLDLTETDDDLDLIAAVVSARAVSLR